MHLTINGETQDLDLSDPSLTALLAHIDMAGKPVVVELNQQPVLPGDHATATIKDGDSLEIVTIAAGG